jgi:diphthamide biosynthesis protein 2
MSTATGSVVLSSNDDEVLHRQVTDGQRKYTIDDLDMPLLIASVLDVLNDDNDDNNNDRRKKRIVAVQCSDAWLSASSEVVECLENETDCKVVVLADTAYGACCVDEVQAQHLQATLVVHVGERACLSQTSHLCAVFAFARHRCNDSRALFDALFALQDRDDDDVQDWLVFVDVCYAHVLRDSPDLVDEARRRRIWIGAVDHVVRPQRRVARVFGRRFDGGAPVDGGAGVGVVYIGDGGESRLRTNVQMRYGEAPRIVALEPGAMSSVAVVELTGRVTRELMKRYYVVQKLKEAETVGILAGTLGVADYMDVIGQLKRAARQSGKRAYTFVVGQLNVAKLANFPDVDVFVLVACPENALVDSKEYYKPIATPYEAQLALVPGYEWSARYLLQFADLDFKEAESRGNESDDDGDEYSDLPIYSLIDGTLKPNPKSRAAASSSTALTTTSATSNALVVGSHSAKSNSGRTWYGLEPRIGETPASQVVQGEHGIASGYEKEQQQ